jgi:flavodoxin
MKILITYYSQTGNTEKIAKSIHEACEGEEVDIKPIKLVIPSDLKKYDLVFLGSGIYASRVNNALAKLIEEASELPPKFAFFCTHASKDGYQDGFKQVKKKLGDSSEVIDEFDCCGESLGVPEAMQKAMMENLPPDKRKTAEEHQKWVKGRPKEEELQSAKEWAKSVLENL